MNREEAKELINKVISHYKAIDKIYDKVNEVFSIAPDGKFFEAIFEMETDYILAVEKLLGDSNESISWYIFDNECGEKGYEASINGEKKNIKTVDDLIWLIFEGKEYE